jgi:hypothetical protein
MDKFVHSRLNFDMTMQKYLIYSKVNWQTLNIPKRWQLGFKLFFYKTETELMLLSKPSFFWMDKFVHSRLNFDMTVQK